MADEWDEFRRPSGASVPLPMIPFTTDWSEFEPPVTAKPRTPPPSPYAKEIQEYVDTREPYGAGDQTAQGILFGFGDEIAGGLGGIGSALQGDGFGKGYEIWSEGERAREQQYKEKYPWRSLGATVFGGALTGAGGARALGRYVPGVLSPAAPGLAVGERVARGAALGAGGGAASGGLTGFGEGEGGFVPRLEGAGVGGLLGGLIGMPFGAAGGALAGGGSRQAQREIVEAFDRSGVEPNIPNAYQNRGVGTISHIVGDSLFGSPLPEQAGRQIEQASRRTDEIADMASSVREPARAGETVQSGLERFATERVPVPAGQSAASLPSRATSWKTKSEALYDRVENMMGAASRRNKGKGFTSYLGQTRGALDEIEKRFKNPGLQSLFKNPAVARVAEGLRSAGDIGVTFGDLRHARTAVRAYLDDDEVLRSVPEAELQKLYQAMTGDMKEMAKNAGKAGSKKGGQQILHALEQADKFYAVGADRIRTVLDKVIKGKSGESVYESLARMAREGSGADWRRMASVRRSLGDAEWDEVVSTTVARLGRSGKTGEAWSPNYFLNSVRNMSPQSAQILFGGTRHQGLRPAIDDLMKVSEQLRRTQRLGNPSGSARMGLMGIGLTGVYYGTQDLATTLGAALISSGGHNVAARVLSSPAAVRWLTNAARLGAQGPRAAPLVSASIGGLSRAFADDPEIADVLANVARQMTGEEPAPQRQ